MTEEQALVQQARQGTRGAFAWWVEHQGASTYLALRDGQSRRRGAVPRPFNAWKGLGNSRGNHAHQYRLTSNVCIDFLRREKQQYPVHDGLPGR